MQATIILTARLTLTPLRVNDADEMAGVLGDERLHEFIGGRPATVNELRGRYRRLVAGAVEPDEVWLNWIVRLRPSGSAVGTVQATIRTAAADVAWVVGVAYQDRGFATEAALALVDWLQNQGGFERGAIAASIHPDHVASMAVAAHLGLKPTDERRDGETVWRLPRGGSSVDEATESDK